MRCFVFTLSGQSKTFRKRTCAGVVSLLCEKGRFRSLISCDPLRREVKLHNIAEGGSGAEGMVAHAAFSHKWRDVG